MAEENLTTKAAKGRGQLRVAEETAEEKERWAAADQIWADLKIITAIGETLRMQSRLQSLAEFVALSIKMGERFVIDDAGEPLPQLSLESLKTLGKLLIDTADKIGATVGESL